MEIDNEGYLKDKITHKLLSDTVVNIEGEQIMTSVTSYVHQMMKFELNFNEIWVNI